MFDVKRLVSKQQGLGALDELRASVASSKSVLPPSLVSSIDILKGFGSKLGSTYGASATMQWDRFSATRLMPELHMLSVLRPGRPVAMLNFFRHEDLVATITSVEPSAEDDQDPRTTIAAVHSEPVTRSGHRGERLRIDAGSILQCRRCFGPFEHHIDLWWTGPNTVLYIGALDGALCENCSDAVDADDLADLMPESALYEIVRGHEDEAPESGEYRIVEALPKDDDE